MSTETFVQTQEGISTSLASTSILDSHGDNISYLQDNRESEHKPNILGFDNEYILTKGDKVQEILYKIKNKVTSPLILLFVYLLFYLFMLINIIVQIIKLY